MQLPPSFGSEPIFIAMAQIETCLGTLRRLITAGDVNGIPMVGAGHRGILGSHSSQGPEEPACSTFNKFSTISVMLSVRKARISQSL
jgi:hypothetical protein